MGGSHTLEKLMGQVAQDVTDPEAHVSVALRRRAGQLIDATPETRKEAKSGEMRIGALGSGSDYTPFLQHLGIAALNLGYGGEGEYGQYHSIYDSYDHYMRFMDPTLQYGVTLAQTAGRVVLRTASADVLPLDFQRFSDTVSRYVKELGELAEHEREETADRNQAIEEKLYEAAADPTETWITPKPLGPVPHLNLAPLENARDRLEKSARTYQGALEKAGPGADALSPESRRQLDQILLKAERALTGPGLPRRPWYVHQIYAPGFYTGYGVKTLPGVREAIEQRNWKEVDEQVAVTAKVLETFAGEVDRAAAILKTAAPARAAADGTAGRATGR